MSDHSWTAHPSSGRRGSTLRTTLALTLALLLVLTVVACGGGAGDEAKPGPEAAVEDTASSTITIPITSTPPKDLPRNSDLESLAVFAWQELLALSWKSAVDSSSSPVGKRGVPDSSWSYSTPGASPELMVWQTYAQTTELRPNGPLTIPWDQLGTPSYSYSSPPVAGTGSPSFTLWNNLDENNEIGSCDIYGQYPSQTTPRNLVLFQVKVNEDEYEYVRESYGADQNDPNGLLATVQASVLDNIKNPPYSYYSGAPTGADATCDCPPDKAICLPCGGASNGNGGTYEGAIEVKSAWRKLLPEDDASRFYTTEALYYDTDSNGVLAYYNDTFALIGIHIIHKTQNFPDFVFATFEQVDVEQANMEYAILNGSTEQLPPVPIVRQTGQTNRNQNHPVPPELDTVSDAAHAQLTALNPETIWQYYRLTGIQGASVDCAPSPDTGLSNPTSDCVANQDPVTCTNLDPNYFMANFVIESDPFLNNFSGPGFGDNAFGNCRNTVFDNQIFDNGGCKGCHGVAQTSFGTDFSFLLDFGNNKPAIAPAPITNPSNDPSTASAAQLEVEPHKNYLRNIDFPELIRSRKEAGSEE